MVKRNEVEAQLRALGFPFRFWNRAEVKELEHILVPGEQIRACMSGRYEGGIALLTATDQRLLLIDKKLFHLTVEDARYDMIAEVDYGAQFYRASVRICMPGKTLQFFSYRPRELRAMATYLQQRVMEIRQQHMALQSAQYRMVQAIHDRQAYPQAPQPTYAEPASYTASEPERAPAPAPLGQQAFSFNGLPTPEFRNPYTQVPLLMRRHFGKIATQQQ
jgi:hypothetical protein